MVKIFLMKLINKDRKKIQAILLIKKIISNFSKMLKGQTTSFLLAIIKIMLIKDRER
jgi:hypothetical protein